MPDAEGDRMNEYEENLMLAAFTIVGFFYLFCFLVLLFLGVLK